MSDMDYVYAVARIRSKELSLFSDAVMEQLLARPDYEACVSFLLEKVAPQTKWRDRMFDLINRYPAVPKEDMGFTSGWQRCPLWSAWVKPATDA